MYSVSYFVWLIFTKDRLSCQMVADMHTNSSESILTHSKDSVPNEIDVSECAKSRRNSHILSIFYRQQMNTPRRQLRNSSPMIMTKST